MYVFEHVCMRGIYIYIVIQLILILCKFRLLQKNSRLIFLLNFLPKLHPTASFFSMGEGMSKTTMPTPQDALGGKISAIRYLLY